MPSDGELTEKQEQAAARRRSSAARIASHASWAGTTDWSSRTAPARSAFMQRFDRQVDPDGTLPPDVRAKRAESAMKTYMGQLAKKRQRRNSRAQAS